MKLSHLFTKTIKNISHEEESVNAKLLTRGGFVNKEMAGVYSYLPLGLKVLKKIENIIREEMNAIGGEEILMPTLTPVDNYKITGRYNLDILFKTKLHSGADFMLNQSHEEVVVPLVKNFIYSYNDLPRYVYQIQNKFRNEPRAKSGLLRAREFIMKDLYSFHTDEKDLDKYYELVKKTYFKLFKRMGLDPILTFASGGSFSKYSHEFQVLTDAGEDEIYLCEKCNVAVNKEIIEEQNSCPECKNKKLIAKKAIEIGNIFKLNTKFSKPFELNFQNKDGKNQLVIMGCYGIGLGRAMGTIAETCHDDKGLIWPKEVAPAQVHIIAINNKEKTLGQKIDKIYSDLQTSGIEVIYDDRDNVSAGGKFADADLIGCPYRIVVSEKTLAQDSVEVKKRNSGKADIVKITKIIKLLNG